MEIHLLSPSEAGELLPADPSRMAFEFNAYKTRAIIPVRINGNLRNWHSLKGGINLENPDPKSLTDPSYEILFDRDSQRWLKIVPPGSSHIESLINRLRQGVQIGRVALLVAGLPELADQMESVGVEIHGGKTYGFLSPHIGFSLEFLLKSSKRSSAGLPAETIEFLSKINISSIYEAAFWQAAHLYLRYGFWTYDPNPGNILIHRKDDKPYPTLIDFCSPGQIKDNKFNQAPSPDRRRLSLQKNLGNLYQSFRKQCGKNGISQFSYPATQIDELVETQLSS